MKKIFVLALCTLSVSGITIGCLGCSGGSAPMNPNYLNPVLPTTNPGVIYKPESNPPLTPFPTPYPAPAFLPANPLSLFKPLNITPDSAVLLGNVNAYPELFRFPVELGFEWRLKLGNKDSWTREMYDPSYQLGMITIPLEGRLTSETGYCYRLFLLIYDPKKEKPTEWKSDEMEFTTLSVSDQVIITTLPPPAPMTFNPLGIMDPAELTSSSATLVGNVALYPERFAATRLGFQWGLTSENPDKWHTEAIAPSSKIGLMVAKIGGLLPHTDYSYRVFLDIDGKPRYYRSGVTFTTH